MASGFLGDPPCPVPLPEWRLPIADCRVCIPSSRTQREHQMALVLTSGPAIEPVTLAEAKAHLRVDGSAEDTLIGSLIITSRLYIEAALGLALITQSWSIFLDAWPPGSQLALPLRPVHSIAPVKLYAADEPVAPVPAVPPPLVRRGTPPRPEPGPPGNGIEIAFVAGYGDAAADVPAPIRQAV